MTDVTCFGEILIDFTPFGVSPTGMKLFEQNAGGAPGNVAVALSRLGYSAAFVGKIGDDINGAFLRKSLCDAGVDTAALVTDPAAYTSMAFVTLSDAGERDFSFVRDADTKLSPDELPPLNTKIFHFGSLSLTHEPSRSSTHELLARAKAAGCIISYDPNYRALLWQDEQTAVRYMASVLDMVDILKVSEEEVELLTGTTDLEAGGKILLKRGPKLVAITQGSQGATLCTACGSIHTPTFAGKVVDTTGAGDAFMGGLLSGLLSRKIHPREVTVDIAADMSRFAHAVATACVASRGGIPAMPTPESVNEILNK